LFDVSLGAPSTPPGKRNADEVEGGVSHA
jgi:hypothetical protein